MPPIMASISRKSCKKVPIIFFQMLLAGRQTHKNKAFFMGSRGFLWGWIMGSQNIMGSDYGSNISGVRGAILVSLLDRPCLSLSKNHALSSSPEN
jgi:hypothetical protein